MNIFNVLVEVSIYAAIIYGIIFLIKKLVGKKMSPQLHFLIWFILIVRLCIPFTIATDTSLIVLPEQPAIHPMDISDSDTAAPAQTNLAESTNSANQQVAISPATAAPTPADNTQLANTGMELSWQSIIILIWIAGMTVQLLRTLHAVYRMKRQFARNRLVTEGHFYHVFERCRQELGIRSHIPLYLSGNLTTPAVTIGLRPVVVMPYEALGQLSDTQLEYAMKHELMHYKRKDHLTSLLLKLLEIVYWFHPAAWLLGRQMPHDIETACDNAVVRRMKQDGKKAYALTLVQLFSGRRSNALALGMALDNREVVAAERIRGIYRKPKSNPAARVICIAAIGIIAISCFTTLLRPVHAQSNDVTLSSQKGATLVETQNSKRPTKSFSSAAKKSTSASPVSVTATFDEENLLTGYTISDTKKAYEQVDFATHFSDNDEARTYNIWKVCSMINGTRINPGEEWSFNDAVGPRENRLGWKSAPGIVDGSYIEFPGGGVSQVVTTLYNAALRSETRVTQAVPHTYPISYAPAGLDATVSTNAPDFTMKNDLDQPVYILVNCDGRDAGKITVSILRPKFEDGYTREFESVYIPSESEKNDTTMVQTFRIDKLLLDKQGNEVSRQKNWDTVTYTYPRPGTL